jgi:hypothetical protein
VKTYARKWLSGESLRVNPPRGVILRYDVTTDQISRLLKGHRPSNSDVTGVKVKDQILANAQELLHYDYTSQLDAVCTL